MRILGGRAIPGEGVSEQGRGLVEGLRGRLTRPFGVTPRIAPGIAARIAERFESRWRYLRRQARKSDLVLIFLAGVVGAAAGGGVVIMRESVGLLQGFFFGTSLETHASTMMAIPWWREFGVPAVGGLAFGLTAYAIAKLRPHESFDAIEANALHGGRMSFSDSLIIAVMTVFSVGVGASVGLEAGVVQLGSGFSSWVGKRLGLPRTFMRTMVGCGAAAAISAAFNAPLAGAFYALELVIGGYAVSALAPVILAAIAGALVARNAFGSEPMFSVAVVSQHLTGGAYMMFGLLGLGAAVIGVLVMRIATVLEATFRRRALPHWLRPFLGGLVIGALALAYPRVLGSGHGGLDDVVNQRLGLTLLLGLVAAKMLASAFSIGSGFRGGLFSASLFLGSIYGAAAAFTVALLAPGLPSDYTAYTLVGMGAVAASVVGAPITMILLVFETTLDYPVAIGVAIGVIVATVATRRWFGYSFATWRFHLRGVELRSAYDIGRLHDLRVRDVFTRNVLRVPATTDINTLCSLFLLGTAKVAFVEDESGVFLGIVDAAEANAVLLEDRETPPTAQDLVTEQPHFLTPADRLSTALHLLEQATTGAVAVVRSADNPRVIGCIHETDVLRRYIEESEKMRQEELG